ncbi:MAG: GHMP family kinase ATP-binding protein [Candidatus Ranarchaeia archaeon]
MSFSPRFKKIVVKAPGRLCLFGDDFYKINGSALVGTITRKLEITITPRKDHNMILKEPDIASHDAYSMYRSVPYTKFHDVIRAVFNSLVSQGYYYPHGGDCEIKSRIPMSAGLASSEALAIAWTGVMLQLLNRRVTPEKLASIAHIAEINAWHIANRFVDFLVISRGGLYFLNPRSEPPLQKLKTRIKGLLLCELAPYGTIQGMWRQRIQEAQDVLERLRKIHATPDFNDLQAQNLPVEIKDLPLRHRRTISGFLQLRELTQKAGKLLRQPSYQPDKLASLLNRVQRIYQNKLKIVSPLMKKVTRIGLKSGALGAKLVGPNWGRLILFYAPEATNQVCQRIKKETKLKTYPVALGNKGFTMTVS